MIMIYQSTKTPQTPPTTSPLITPPSLGQLHLVTTRSRQSQPHLKTIINQPLKRRQCPNHQNPNRQAIPQSLEPNIPINARHGFPRALALLAIRVEFRDHDVRGVRDDGAAYAGDVAAEEGDAGLLQAVVGGFGLAEVRVDGVDGRFEGREFYHCVGDLAAPEGVEAFVKSGISSQCFCLCLDLIVYCQMTSVKLGEWDIGQNSPSIPLLLNNLPHALPQTTRKRRQRRLHPNLNTLKRTQRDISQELCARARGQEHGRRVHAREQLLAIRVLEDFVEAVLAAALEAVADECGRPAEEDAAETFGSVDCAPGL